MLWNKHSLLLLRARTTHQCMKTLYIGTYFIWRVNQRLHSTQECKLECHALFFINTTIPKQLQGEKRLGPNKPSAGLKKIPCKWIWFSPSNIQLTWMTDLVVTCRDYFSSLFFHITPKPVGFPFQLHLFGTVCLNNRWFLLKRSLMYLNNLRYTLPSCVFHTDGSYLQNILSQTNFGGSKINGNQHKLQPFVKVARHFLQDPLFPIDYNFAKLQTIWAEIFYARCLP